MAFLTTGAYTTFTANTKAKSAEVNSNFSAIANFLNTITSDALVGSVWQKIANTAASHTLTASDSIRTFLVNVNTSAGYTLTLPTAAASTHRMLTIKNTGLTTGALTIDGAGSETIDNTITVSLPPRGAAATLHCDGTSWHTLGRVLGGYIDFTPTTSGFVASSFDHSFYRVDGDILEGWGRFTISTATGSEARYGLPSPYTVNSKLASRNFVGTWTRNATGVTTKRGPLQAVASNSYVTFGVDHYDTGADPLAAANGNDWWSTGNVIVVSYRIVIA